MLYIVWLLAFLRRLTVEQTKLKQYNYYKCGNGMVLGKRVGGLVCTLLAKRLAALIFMRYRCTLAS